MYRTFICALAAVYLPISSLNAAEWQPLLDENLSQWDTYLGYPRPETEVPGLPKDAKGEYSQPIGYGRDDWGVFTVAMEDGQPVLRISGEIYGGIFTRRDYGNYHLRLQVKWGSQKWPPRLDLPLDSGILYHGAGEHGVDYWRAWPLSQEFQIVQEGVEGMTGDWWKIGHSQIDIRCRKPTAEAPYQFDAAAPLLTFGSEDGADITCRASHNNEKPHGQWNTLELITYEDKSLHIVNGEVVMALSNSGYPEDGEVHPLTRGQLVLQSEAGEVFFRAIELKAVDGIPKVYESYFD